MDPKGRHYGPKMLGTPEPRKGKLKGPCHYLEACAQRKVLSRQNESAERVGLFAPVRVPRGEVSLQSLSNLANSQSGARVVDVTSPFHSSTPSQLPTPAWRCRTVGDYCEETGEDQ